MPLKTRDYVTYLAQDCKEAVAEFALSLLWVIRQATKAQLSAQKYRVSIREEF